jgi:hypothetical protein
MVGLNDLRIAVRENVAFDPVKLGHQNTFGSYGPMEWASRDQIDSSGERTTAITPSEESAEWPSAGIYPEN